MKPAALLACAAALLANAAVAAPAKNDFPTLDRVNYVLECVRQHPGPEYEMLSKCSCALDKIAAQVAFDDYTTMSTAANANSIGGERGNVIRDAEAMQKQIKRYRDVQSQAKKACFINSEPQR